MPREERKLVSVLFVDIVGSTARAHGADPEDVRDVLRRFHAPVRALVEQHEGVIEKFIGDAVVAVFGTPRSHGDDALRAVRCGLRIAEAVEELNRADAELQLAIRAGVATGEAVVDLGSDAGRGEAVAVGDVMNTAARLQAAAPPGRVVVGELTERATRRAIRYQRLDSVEAKGFPEPLPAWLALGAAVEARTAATPLLGRDSEMAALQEAFASARQSPVPQFVTVLGPPGMGKSRLAAEFSAWVELQGGQTYRGRCLPYAERRAYQATVDQIKQIAGIYEADTPEAARAKVAEAVSRYAPDEGGADLTHHLSLLLALGLDDPIRARSPLFFAARRLLEGVGAERPAVFVFDDLHWADESQLELIDYLRRSLAGRCVLLFLARPELEVDRAAWVEATRLIRLGSLPDAEAEDLARRLLGDAAGSIGVTRLVSTAGGNPLFLEELAVSVRHGSAAERLPVTVREAIAAHIDSLADEQRSVLLDAAVIGDTFWQGILAAVRQEDGAALGGPLEHLAAQGLVRRSERSRVEGDLQFAFKHVLVQEVAYSTLTRAARRQKHAAVARYVEERAGADSRGLAAFLAHHWRSAGESGRAIDHLLIAAEGAREAWAQDEVLAHYDAALELAVGDGPLRTRIKLQRGLALVRLGDFPTAAAELDAVLPELEPNQELEAVMARTFCAYWMEETAASLRFADRGRELARELGDAELQAVAAMYAGLPHEYTGDLDQLEARYEEARRLWVPGTRRPELAALNEYEADLRYWTGEYEKAEELARAAYEMGGGGHHLEAFLRGGGWRGLSLAALGRSEEALAWMDQIIATAQEVDSRWGAAILNYSSLPLRDMLRLDEAAERNREALELVSTRGAWGMPELQGEIDLCLTDLRRGEPGRVQRDFPRLWDAAVNGKAWRPWLGGLRLSLVRAELARLTEAPEQLLGWASETRERARASRRRKYEAAAAGLVGVALARMGRVEEAGSELRQAVALADAIGSPTPRWELRLDQSRVLYDLGNDAGAEAARREAGQIIAEYAATLSAENARYFLDRVSAAASA